MTLVSCPARPIGQLPASSGQYLRIPFRVGSFMQHGTLGGTQARYGRTQMSMYRLVHVVMRPAWCRTTSSMNSGRPPVEDAANWQVSSHSLRPLRSLIEPHKTSCTGLSAQLPALKSYLWHRFTTSLVALDVADKWTTRTLSTLRTFILSLQ